MSDIFVLTASENMKSEYCCNIIRVGEIKPIEGSDFLGQTFINGESVVVRKDQVHEGDIYFFAMNECQLNDKFLKANSLFRENYAEENANYEEDVKPLIDTVADYTLEVSQLKQKIKKLERAKRQLDHVSDPEAPAKFEQIIKQVYPNNYSFILSVPDKKMTIIDVIADIKKSLDSFDIRIKDLKNQIARKCGFFERNGRVRAIRLKGTPSFGYMFSKEELIKAYPEAADIDMESHIGFDFDTVAGELFVQPYIPKVTAPSKRGSRKDKAAKKYDRLVPGEFAFHYDTDPLGKNMWKLKPTDNVAISVKCHGCVERNTLIETKEYGTITIGEIVDKKLNCHIKAYDTNINQIVYVPIDNFYFMPNDGDWYEIELENGKKITITGNNPVWLPDKEIYRRVDELKGDEYLLID